MAKEDYEVMYDMDVRNAFPEAKGKIEDSSNSLLKVYYGYIPPLPYPKKKKRKADDV